MDKIEFKNRVFGAGNRILTIIGAMAGALVALGQYLDYVPLEYRSQKWYAVAVALVALGAAMRLPSKRSEPPGPDVTAKLGLLLLGLGLAGPAMAQGFPGDSVGAGTVDPGAEYASSVAEAPAPRWSFTYKSINVAPSISFSPTVLSVRNFSLSVGPNVGAGVDITAVKGAAVGYGAALHATLRETVNGNRPLASMYAILPFLAQYKVRPGVSYQIGGGEASYKDAFLIGFAVSDNFGYQSK